ncbi:uncharacterized protein LOC125236622 isoform X3 [Leguminivora glycinivorella]|nr:uncharacterized protein LOC125236622 isoform X3 [Leguminivora glycinivorella]
MAWSCLVAFWVFVGYLQVASCDLPEKCVQHSECPEKMACESESSVRGVDPCLASLAHAKCGTAASCVVDEHVAKCRCDPGTLGDPYESCSSSVYDVLLQGGVG